MSDKDDILNDQEGPSSTGRISLDADSKQPGADRLMDYVSGDLTPEEQREVELWLSDDGMESDALEGLKMLEPAVAKHSVHHINHQLNKTLGSKKNKRRKAQTDQTTVIAIVIILLLMVVAWLVIKFIS